jgi:hypothetical protein
MKKETLLLANLYLNLAFTKVSFHQALYVHTYINM